MEKIVLIIEMDEARALICTNLYIIGVDG